MKRLFLALFALVLSVGMGLSDAEAKRLGGGSSIGMQRQGSSPSSSPSSTPSAPSSAAATAPSSAPAGAAAAQPRRNSCSGPLPAWPPVSASLRWHPIWASVRASATSC